MKLLLDGPVFYSKDSMYVANVKESDFTIVTDPVDISKAGQELSPAVQKVEAFRDVVVNTLQPQIFQNRKRRGRGRPKTPTARLHSDPTRKTYFFRSVTAPDSPVVPAVGCGERKNP